MCVLQGFNIQAGQDVGVRVVFPRRLLYSTENASVQKGAGLQKIIDEEKRLGSLEESKSAFKLLWFVSFITPMVFVLVLFLILWFLFGREPKAEYDAIYEREPPYDYSPAIVSALINQDTQAPSPDAILAVIMDLCLKKYFVLEQVKNESGNVYDYKIVLMEKAKNEEIS
ncbi:MAG: DUF2207 domain-containing protein, partial [Candidatus Diapherotrites archaeon]